MVSTSCPTAHRGELARWRTSPPGASVLRRFFRDGRYRQHVHNGGLQQRLPVGSRAIANDHGQTRLTACLTRRRWAGKGHAALVQRMLPFRHSGVGTNQRETVELAGALLGVPGRCAKPEYGSPSSEPSRTQSSPADGLVAPAGSPSSGRLRPSDRDAVHRHSDGLPTPEQPFPCCTALWHGDTTELHTRHRHGHGATARPG